MTTLITVELSDECAQQLQAEAQQQNTTVESFLAQYLTQTLRTTSKETTLSMPPREWLAGYYTVAEMFSFIRAAKQFNRDHIQIPATPLARHIANQMVQHNFIRSVEVDPTPPFEFMTLHLLAQMPATSNSSPNENYSLDDLLNLPTDNLELKQILEKLKDPDPNICIQGINALGDLYSEPA
jgi:ribosomal protein S8